MVACPATSTAPLTAIRQRGSQRRVSQSSRQRAAHLHGTNEGGALLLGGLAQPRCSIPGILCIKSSKDSAIVKELITGLGLCAIALLGHGRKVLPGQHCTCAHASSLACTTRSLLGGARSLAVQLACCVGGSAVSLARQACAQPSGAAALGSNTLQGLRRSTRECRYALGCLGQSVPCEVAGGGHK